MPTSDTRLVRGQSVPFFEVTTTEGRPVAYEDLWQRRALLLLSVMEEHDFGLAEKLRAQIGDEAEVVVTAAALPGLPHPGVLVADRWGEIQHLAPLVNIDEDDLAEWVRYVVMQCPECEGEAR